MNVEILDYTKDGLFLCAISAQTCYSENKAEEILKSITEEKAKEIMSIVISSGHLSILEHVKITFSISNVSRTLTHQLVRHRIASFSQQSQRYVNLNIPSFVSPHTIKKNKRALKIYNECMFQCWKSYKELIKLNIPVEDSRFCLPNATKTNIVTTMNLRELLLFFNLRCCKKAQWEIRQVANNLLNKCKKLYPFLLKDAGANCEKLGFCPETKSCGKYE